tara:strand:- start:892 stop:4224 length:3333 start_codon:yes stop_codon:yes gene_type:complete
MASIRKSFSFRNGVQVDEDNFIVNANGLVGIGTSIPNEALDVRGTAKVVGLVTASDVFVSGVATITEIQVGSAITIGNSGVITATSFKGDGSTLSNLPTSQWTDVDVGLGYTSIYAAGNVGIATTDPRNSFQVGGTPGVAGKKGVGISSIGNVRATGIVTATSFVGALTGNVVGNVTGAVTGNVTGNITGNVDGNVNSGISTLGVTNASTLTVSGVTTSNAFVGPLTGDVTGNVTGNMTGNVTGNLTGNVTGNITGDIISGIATASTELNVGTGGTALTSLNTGRVGIGSAIPKSDLTIRKASDASLEIIGESGQTKVSLGKSDTDGNESALIRYGNPDGTLNFVNYNPGSVNTFIHAGSGTGIQTGRFSWIYGQSNAELLSLTHEGKLGVGKTNPESNFEVVGVATVSSNLGVGGNLDVAGDINLTGDISLPSLIGGSNIEVNTGISTFNNIAIGGTTKFNQDLFAETSNLFVNKVGVETGAIIDTSFALKVAGKSEIDYIGIGTTASPTENMGVVGYGVGSGAGADTSNGLHLFSCKVGINSSSVYIRRTDISTSGEVTLSMGSTNTKAIIDFSDAGKGDGTSMNPGISTARFMLPPIVTTTERVGLTTVAGGLVYNSSLNKLQNFDGTTWTSLGSGGGSSSFTGLSDTPGSLTARKYLRVNSAGNALELRNSGVGDGFVNIADYGADTSATDGTNVTAINNAIAALGTNGGTVYIPGGMFYLNAAIELTQAANENSIRFVGAGQQNYGGGGDTGGSVLRRDADDEFFNITNSRAIHFVGITFKGGAANGAGGDSGISGGNGAIHVIANAGCQGYLIENCVFHGIANCITFKGLSDSIIRGCRFRNVPANKGGGSLIGLNENVSSGERSDQIRIQDCVLDGYVGSGSTANSQIDGISMYNTVNTVFITNTSAIRCRRGFYTDTTWDGDFLYFQNAEAERAILQGFHINGTGNFITFDNCFSSTNESHGIHILSDQNSSVNITNPNVRDNVGHGILIDANTINNCSIVNPAIGGNSRGSSGSNHGIFIGTNVNNVYISGGKIGGNTTELSGTGTQGRGVLINGNTHSNIRIIGTNVTGNVESDGIGASISSGTGNSVKFNAGSTVDIDT